MFSVKRISDVAEVTGIGGKVESEENFLEAALRECVEETGVRATVIPSGKTWEMHQGECREVQALPDRTLFVVRKPVTNPGHEFEIRVYAAIALGEPHPQEEPRHLLLVPPQLLGQIRAGDLDAGSFEDRGGVVVGDPIESDVRLAFIDSPQTYAGYLLGEVGEHVEKVFRSGHATR